MRKVILIDGMCTLCEYSVRWIQCHDKAQQFQYIPVQSDEGKGYVEKYGVELANIETVLYITEKDVFRRSDAFFEILAELDAWPRSLLFLRRIPKPLRDGLYRLIAKNRYRLFGKRSTCLMP
ncbi:MAG: DUF393 domain-containing protein [Gammaproteobacteria bacterium]|nr:DUF393 domain-containing protein [Gammaproteobacteria bacterium]